MRKSIFSLTFFTAIFCSLLCISSAEAISYGRVISNTGSDVRTGPSTSYSKITSLSYNDTVSLVTTTTTSGTGCSLGWYKIIYDGKEYYTCKNNVSMSTYTIKSNYNGNLNVRLEPGANKKLYTTIPNNKTVTLYTTTKYKGNGCSSWYRLHFNGGNNRYICATYTDTYNSKSNVIGNYLTGTNIRKKANSSSAKIKTLKYGEALTLDSTTKYKGNGCSSGWYKIYTQGKTGYVCSAYATPSNYVYKVNNLNSITIREKANSSSKKIATLKYDTSIILNSTSKYTGTGCTNGYYQIKYNGKNAYACSTYLTSSKIATNIILDNSNIRTGAGTSYDKITTIAKNKKVYLLSTTKYKGNSGCTYGWYKLSINGKTGYTCSTNTELGKTKTTTTTTPTTTNGETITKSSKLSTGNYYYKINKWDYRTNEHDINVRTSPTGSVITSLYLGAELDVLGEKSITAQGCTGWYKIKYYTNKEGYICKRYVDKYSNITKTNTTYCNTLKNKGFPESYCPYLSYLHYKHPNWIFKPDKTGITFSKTIEGEQKKNTIDKYSTTAVNKAYLYSTTVVDAGGWRRTSDAFNAFMLDPRNYLNEKRIFAFEVLSFDEQNHKKATVKDMLGTSHLATDDYAAHFVEVGKKYKISPLHLASRIIQEGTSNKNNDSVSGTVSTTWGSYKGYICSSYATKNNNKLTVSSSINLRSNAGTNYKNTTYANGKAATVNSKDTVTLLSTTKKEGTGCTSGWYYVKVNKSLKGIYNYYNIGAYDGTNPILRGLATAAGYVDNYTGTPWNTRKEAIEYGAKFISDGYISSGQDTLYYQKFNTTPNSESALYTHQYMTNVLAPSSEAANIKETYTDFKLINKAFTFKIPVYTYMPSYTTHPPVK